MSERVIPILDVRGHPARRPGAPVAAPLPDVLASMPLADGALPDALGRPLHDLRISVTDRCNFRCSYCMPREVFGKDHPFLPHDALLSFEEIAELAALFVALGVRKIRLTGGEPLLRRNIERLIEQLARLRRPDGQAVELTLTTNGSLLARKAEALKAAGLSRITVSLDSLDDALFRRLNDADYPVARVLDGIEAARVAGFSAIKVNMVVRRGLNDGDILPMVEHFRGSGHILRFIEYMDVGATNGWRMDEVLPSREVLARIQAVHPLEALEANYPGEVASRWRFKDGAGEIGLISSVTQPFCGDCTRLRLSTEGQLYTCLFAHSGYDLKALLRGGRSTAEMATALSALWQGRQDRYSELRSAEGASSVGTAPRRIEMSYIGG
ncbi:MAG: GTP 3',8-cyclase MoaA [Lautropia sp.]|nr:GTP 3',8-cyclase MoaA [Lautropia sp.]